VMVGSDDLVATYEGGHCVTNDMMDVWRNPEDQYVKQWEGRFVLGEGFSKQMKKVVKGILKKYDLSPADITKVVFPAPDPRSHKGLVKSLGFTEAQAQNPMLAEVGHCGVAHSLMMLTATLESAKAGDLVLLAAYGDGADALLFKATGAAGNAAGKVPMASLLESKMMFSSYSRFLSYKGVLEAQPGEPFRLLPSATATWREQNSAIRCHASKCNHCGVTTFPIQRVCCNCRTKDDFSEVRLSDRSGTVFTFTRDNFAGRPDDPVIIQTVAELDGEVRFYGLMTDCDPAEVEVGQPVELTFRKIYEGAGFHNYFWKLRPLRKGGDE
ncbi:MAG: OB-fold domain-containing protein, partial [Deltaproteobacteria bacterium]|nr:OB-fold domain-containing protein [Deltaproteobacteria bacterium]